VSPRPTRPYLERDALRERLVGDFRGSVVADERRQRSDQHQRRVEHLVDVRPVDLNSSHAVHLEGRACVRQQPDGLHSIPTTQAQRLTVADNEASSLGRWCPCCARRVDIGCTTDVSLNVKTMRCVCVGRWLRRRPRRGGGQTAGASVLHWTRRRASNHAGGSQGGANKASPVCVPKYLPPPRPTHPPRIGFFERRWV
jgi:hypothetical protein